MNQQPDKLFRDKLYHYERRLSPDAWRRISEGREKAPRRSAWYAVAATVALLAATAVLLLIPADTEPVSIAENSNHTNTPLQPTEKAIGTNDTIVNLQDSQQPSSPTEKDVHSTPGAAREKVVPGKTKSRESGTTDPPPSTVPAIASEDSESVESRALAQVNETENSSDSGEPVSSGESNVGKKVTIVLSAELVNEKYLLKKEIPDATPSGKEPSTLRKLIDIAYDLKHNQDPMGDLRQKKDQIFALNFNRGKERNEN